MAPGPRGDQAHPQAVAKEYVQADAKQGKYQGSAGKGKGKR